ncbi:hypothetical protein BKA82DRAFT_603915 [Pisolithus tinctorius]|uniref:Uncharacterized protein n=1 Tax=Pisolithus tinctorius Marx 270 TaxID=870435 RepID=A0A0C3NTB6_PISTI|nr:hypothetical protein BKA82DRAFT_603915 [Pisolithus tinctorius]KIO04135.1 hypothetical protein M404DRAFT_603915 [Pisolithus tinctorius Marx 270]
MRHTRGILALLGRSIGLAGNKTHSCNYAGCKMLERTTLQLPTDATRYCAGQFGSTACWWHIPTMLSRRCRKK